MINRFLKSLVPKFIDRSLRAKVTLGIVLPLVIILGTFTVFDNAHHRSVLLNNISVLSSYNGQIIKDALWHSMLKSDFGDVQRILDSIGKNENFRVVYLLDTSGKVIFSPNGAGTGEQLDNRNPTCLACHKYSAQERPSSVVVTAEDGQRVFRSMQTIENSPACSKCHDPKERLIGLLLTDIYVAPFETALTADMNENLLWWISTILVAAAFANLAMSRLVINRVEKVTSALAKFGSGKRDLHLVSGSFDEIGQLEKDFNEMAREIQAEEAENRALSEDLHHQTNRRLELLKRLITAQEDERKRLARELHDELGQSLTGLALRSEAMGQYIHSDPEKAREQLVQTREMIGKTTQQMYEIILALRPSILDDLGLVVALRSLAERVLKGSGITFKLDSSKMNKRLPPSIETTLYRILQEALNNIVKHSGASQVIVNLALSDGIFDGEIIDNGKGFDTESDGLEADNPRGLGLLGMQERVALFGGTMEIISRLGQGTRILVQIAIAKADYE